LRVGFNIDTATVTVLIIFSEDDSVVQIVAREFARIPADKIVSMYKVCNDCNSSYRWACFYVDEDDGEIICKADAEIQLDSCAEEIFNIVMRVVGIVKDALPKFMKAMWS
ncbi:MAG: YbjN domain-containing protein, partial [Lachnospiraceae bacterium]|nr:YbjN domain-containing protein [Lachnospiraceae bacterium]